MSHGWVDAEVTGGWGGIGRSHWREWGGGCIPEGRGLTVAAVTCPGLALEEGPGGYAYDPPCRWLEATDLQAGVPATLGNGTRLQLAGVPAGVLARPGLRPFYCCTGCGKVFWEGSHLGRIAAHFSEVLGGAPGSRAQPPSAPPEDQPPTLPAYFRQGPTVKVKKAPAKRT